MSEERPVADLGIDLTVFRGTLALSRDRNRGSEILRSLQAHERTWESLSERQRNLVQGVPLIDFLLEKSAELRYQDPAGMVRFAEMARMLTEVLKPRRYGAKLLANLKARAWGELGNAYRVADDLDAAEAALRRAAALLFRRGTGDLRLGARLSELMAKLFSDRRRFTEATELMAEAVGVHLHLGDYTSAGRALISQGLIAGYGGDPRSAIWLFLQSLRRLGPEADPSLTLAAVHGLALNLCEAGLHDEAHLWVTTTKGLYSRQGDSLNMLRLQWLEGKIAYGLEEFETAEASFRAARLGFENVSKYGDAALVSLDLALLLAHQGRRLETLQLVDEMVATFKRLGIVREGIASLLVLRKACEAPASAPEVLCGQIRVVAALVGKLQARRPGTRE